MLIVGINEIIIQLHTHFFPGILCLNLYILDVLSHNTGQTSISEINKSTSIIIVIIVCTRTTGRMTEFAEKNKMTALFMCEQYRITQCITERANAVMELSTAWT